ncbi:MAG: alpha/beta hydrolase [Solirubrobacteraceae bacterium]|nr:alpha/beta hydrolase [Solirubrobacteraceae bacterium]
MTPAPIPPRLKRLASFCLAGLALASLPDAATAAAPDPLQRGPYATSSFFQYKVGTVNLQEPSSTGGPTTGVSAATTLQVRGSMYYPSNLGKPAPVIVLVHGNHGGCQQGGAGGTAPNCTIFNRNDQGYSYLAENLATWGYAVASIDQDQLMSFQDNGAKGMHQRRLMIAAQLDGLYAANEAVIPDDTDHNVGAALVGKLDFSRVGLMGHSRGGDAVTSFMDYNRTRPAPGRRYNVAGVISLAPVDYERRSPYGAAYLTILPACDGDVSNLQGARFYERAQRIMPGDPYPKIQMYHLGANHGNYNSVWSADSDDAFNVSDPACGADRRNPVNDTSIRLSGGVDPTGVVNVTQKANSFLATYERSTAFSPDPALMGDQEKAGLATMSAFFRRYIGGEIAFDPYMTGELRAEAGSNNLPASACPTSPTGTRIACNEYLQTSYFAAATERTDVIGPDTDAPLTTSELGTAITASGFSNPYPDNGGVSPRPAKTESGLDWCNPEPDHFQRSTVGTVGLPTAPKACPLPAPNALGGQSARRENAPVNESYGEQLAVAWDDPVAATGKPAVLETRIPAAEGDVSDLKALSLGAAVNFFDTRNPERTPDALWNPALTTQDFQIVLTDAAGKSATVSAADKRYGTALQQTTGNNTTRVHIVLNQLRVPLADFAAQGIDLTSVRKVSFVFGAAGFPSTGAIQLADVRFQEAATGPTVLTGRSSTAALASTIASTARVSPASAPDVIELGASAQLGAACIDAAAPTGKVLSRKLARRTLTITGKAADTGCGAAVKSVQVGLSKKSGSKYRYVTGNGTLSKALPKGSPLTVVAKGTSAWSLKVSKLPKGIYAVTITVIDAGGNVTTKPAGSVTVR